VADDDRAVMNRLAALEAEVKADADAAQARKTAALSKLRDQRVIQSAESDRLRKRQAELLARKQPQLRPMPTDDRGLPPGGSAAAGRRGLIDDAEVGELEDLGLEEHRSRGKRGDKDRESRDSIDLGGALELASQANRVKQELARAPGKGEKSWIKSGVASLALGPVGWLYAGSWREAVPASAAWVALLFLATKILPMVLLMPVLMVVAPLSAIGGVIYALQYNRSGGRQRLFGKDKDRDQKQLRGGSDRGGKKPA
jgi:hypothetical protein